MKKIFYNLLLIQWLGFFSAFSQTCPTYTSMSGVLTGTSQILSVNGVSFAVTGKPVISTLRERNKSAKLYFKMDLGEDYIKEANPNWRFSVNLIVLYQFAGGGTTARTVSITEASPEMWRSEDVLSAFATGSPSLATSFSVLSITDGTNTLSGAGLLQDFIFNHLRIKVELVREYEVDVRLASNQKIPFEPVIQPVTINNRLVSFSWQPNGSTDFPNYELQVLKVINTEASLANDANQIKGAVDWSRALKVDLQSCKKTTTITIGEGSGYYIWRVRPLGNYFPGGSSNSENYGRWSFNLPANTNTVQLSKVALTPTNVSFPYTFYFTDPDENINWIYNRIFTEGDFYDKGTPTGVKTSEGINYAGGLLHSKQTQKFNSSENNKLISQNVVDYSGRPSLTAIPVPSTGGLTGYKSNLLQDNSGDLYTAKNFDDDANFDNPDPVKDNSTLYSYYSENNSASTNGLANTNVPSAQGFPYKRTLYKADGSNKVVEESGIGKTHSIGSQVAGQGHTTRIYYSTPSDDELIRIFGEEAPLSQSVLKTTTIDANEVISITYTSKEGKTIATSLMSNTVSNLGSVAAATTFTVNNTVDDNTYQGGKVVASKRISISENGKVINLAHYTSSLPGDGGCISASCNYKLRLFLKDVNNNNTYVSDANVNVSGVNDFTITTGTSLTFTNWAFVPINGVGANIVPTASASNQIILNQGEYVFVKELYSTNAPDYAESLVNEDEELTRPIYEALAEMMKDVDGPLKKIQFDIFMVNFRAAVTAYQSSPSGVASDALLTLLCVDKNQLKSGYLFPLANKFNLQAATTNTADASMEDLTITTSCCGNLSVLVPKANICIACEGSSDPTYQATVSINSMTLANSLASNTIVTPYGFVDFTTHPTWDALPEADKRYAMSHLVEREFIDALKEAMVEEKLTEADLWKVAPGFSFESLNFMISNMLISQYYTGSAIESSGTWYEASVGSLGGYTLGPVVSASSPTYAYNYDCKKLSNAWQTAIALINSMDADGGSGNTLKEYDSREAGGSSSGPGSAISEILAEKNWVPWLRDLISDATIAIKKVVNKFRNKKEAGVPPEKAASLVNVIVQFINIIEPQYAAIIDGGPLPDHISSSNDRHPDDYFSFSPVTTLTPSTIYTTIITGNATTGTVSNVNVPILFGPSGSAISVSTISCNSNIYNELYYPYILKPEWMFKYYVYNVFENNLSSANGAVDFIDDASVVLPNQVNMDIHFKYNPPFSYLTPTAAGSYSASNLCIKPATSSFTIGSTPTAFEYTHLNWTSRERYTFYEEIQGGGSCYEDKGIGVSDDLFDTPSNLPTCATKAELFDIAKEDLDQRIAYCQNRRTEIILALVKELEAACYTIVPCPTNVTGQITMNEIGLMADAVVAQATAALQAIRNNFTVTPSSFAACSSAPVPSVQVYSPISSCSLPFCIQLDCQEIMIYENNTIGLTGSRNLEMKFFTDCDQKILNMLENGDFLPDIPALQNCTKPPKPWVNCSDGPACGNYTEKATCPTSSHERHSKVFTVTATGY